MLPDSVYYGYYGNNDWRDYVEHSIGCWKNKAVKYIDKVVGPGGKVRYIYDKKWGTNRSKESYRTGSVSSGSGKDNVASRESVHHNRVVANRHKRLALTNESMRRLEKRRKGAVNFSKRAKLYQRLNADRNRFLYGDA